MGLSKVGRLIQPDEVAELSVWLASDASSATSGQDINVTGGQPMVEGVGELLARDQIRTLTYRYASAIEARDVDAMIKLYSPTARFGSHGQGPDGLRRLMTDSLGGSVFAVILVANHLIELADGDQATGQVWAHCFAQTATDGFVEQLIRYDDRYECIEGRWLFARRRHRLWYGTRHVASPLAQRAANWPRSQVGVGDLPLADRAFATWWEKRDATDE